MIRAIAAADDKLGLAKDGEIPWVIPEDIAYFRQKTLHSAVIMGKDTYEVFSRSLPDRRNLVASRSLSAVRPGFELIDDVEAFFRQSDEDIWIIGGAGLFGSTLQYCDELYLTRVQGDFDCDRFFPEFKSEFSLVEESTVHEQDGYRFKYATYKKNR